MDPITTLQRLGVALAIGLLIGLERGWHQRQESEGERLAGIRTFGLTGILGGVWALLGQELGTVALGLGFGALAGTWILAHMQIVRRGHAPDYGITTVVAALLTFSLGSLAMAGFTSTAAAVAVVTAVLLGLKPVLHAWLGRLTQTELTATLKLALISVVVLPVLPNRGYGPWGALNPYAIWWLVVLIAGISFVGYFAMKTIGPRRGIPVTGLFGGLASSTATTLSFARLGRREPALARLLAAGVTISAATMFPRILLEAAVVNPDLVPGLALPIGLMGVIGLGAAGLLWRFSPGPASASEMDLRNPFELWPALQFGALLVGVLLLAEAARAWLGEEGIYALAGISGLTDVDAITLSLARMASQDLDPGVAVGGITLAAMVNTAVKAILAGVIGGRGMAWPVAGALLAVLAAGALVLPWSG